MSLEEKIATGHDPAVKSSFQKIRKALEENRPDLIKELEKIVEIHEKATRELYGMRTRVINAERDAYVKRFGK